MQTSAPSPRHLNGRLIFFASICIIWLLQVLSLSMENFSQRVRHGKRKNAQKKFEHPPNPMVYYSMDNLRGRLGSTRHERGLGCNADSSTNSEGIIEGKMSVNSLSDLSPLQIFGCELRSGQHPAGQRSNTGATVWWTPWSGGLQGLSACAELKSASHWSRNHGNPCAEKGMHTRSQQIFFSRSRMGWLCADAHARDAAVAQRLHSATFGGGETRMQMRELQRSGGQ